MDDLDHSMHIAEYDWSSFYEESEECGLLKPLLAYPDNPSLSDSDDSGNSSLVSSVGQQKTKQTSAENRDEIESNAAECCLEQVQMNQRASAGEQEDLKCKAEDGREIRVTSGICLNHPEMNDEIEMRYVTEDTNNNSPTTQQTEHLNVQSSVGGLTEKKNDNGDVQAESDTCKLKSIQRPDPLSCYQTETNADELHTKDRAVSEDVSNVAEKERWFVTVNESPARQRVRAPAVKKKRRQKKNRKDTRMYKTPGHMRSLETGSEFETMRDNRELSEGGRDTSAGYASDEGNPDSDQVHVTSDVSQLSSEEDCLSVKQVMLHLDMENIIEPGTDRGQHEASSTAPTSCDTFRPEDPSQSDGVESDDFFSIHSYDSESYLSATETAEESQLLLMENQQPQSFSPLTDSYFFNSTENANADDTQERALPCCDSTLSCNVTATNYEGDPSIKVEPTQILQSASQGANKMPDHDYTCDKDEQSSMLSCKPLDTPPVPLKLEINLSASGCSSGDQPNLLPVPDLTVTPCSVADSPETYANAAGDPRPVYAISAFWDEMEKLTINDILQLRVGRSTPPRDTPGAVTPDVTESPTNHSPMNDTVEYNLSDGGLIDTSDTADSDYFTQPDECKPGRSSCEFSTSDFEEEYWQFLGASRNPSPDPQSRNQKGTSESPYFEEQESICSEGKETPVPTEDIAGQCFEYDDSNTLISSERAWPRCITKIKSVFNVQALNSEDVSLQLLLSNDKNDPYLGSCPSPEENKVLEASDNLGSLIPTTFLSSTHLLDEKYQISVPEAFEYFYTEDKAKGDPQCVAVYDPEDMAVTPSFGYSLCTIMDETPLFSLLESQCSEKKPIPIFTCSHPTVRELTFPNPDIFFLSTDWKEQDVISPVTVVSRAFLRGSDFGTFGAALQGLCSWKSLLPMRKISFFDKGSIWCGGTGAWVFPVENDKITFKRKDPPVSVLTEGGTLSTLFKELAVQQVVLEATQTTGQEGIFSTLKQSDMCLVCIAFASWVLRSTDPKAADAWKAALLANVSALSAIQYLRQYVKKKNPSHDDP